jgi:hypothetical protein
MVSSSAAAAGLEPEIQACGLELWKRIAGQAPGVFNRDYWQGLILEWAMRDPVFKNDMFRLVDALPSLESTEQIAEHVRGLLLRNGRELPAVLATAIKLASAPSPAARAICSASPTRASSAKTPCAAAWPRNCCETPGSLIRWLPGLADRCGRCSLLISSCFSKARAIPNLVAL